ncbi:MAG: InlB B-repeat-containing protein [Clostridia bacterium]
MKTLIRINKIKRFVATILLFFSLYLILPDKLVQTVHAGTDGVIWTVVNLNDVGVGSLRNTIINTASGDTIVFQSGLTGTIVLSSQLTIDKSLSIIGPGAASLTISGNNQCRVFKITSGDVSLSGFTVANGITIGADGNYGYDGFGGGGGGGGGAGAGGGGMLITGGTVVIDSIAFSNNSAIGGHGGSGGDGWQFNPSPDGYGGDGGTSDMVPGSIAGEGGNGNHNYGEDVINWGNYSGGGGGHGGARNGNGSSGGNAYYLGGNGGAGGNHGGQPFYWDMAGYGGDGGQGGTGNGGAVCLTNGSLYISNSSFTGNTAIGGVGGNAGSSNYQLSGSDGLYFGGHGGDGGIGRGGAIYIGDLVYSGSASYQSGTVEIVNSTFSGNSASGGTGGLSAGPAFENGYTGDHHSNGICNKGTIGLRNVTGDTDGLTTGMTYSLRGSDAGESTITSNLANISVESGGSTITVTLNDSIGLPVFGETVTLNAESGSPSIYPSSASTDINGRAVFTVSNTRAETVILAARNTSANMTVSQRLTLSFTPGLTNANTSSITASPSSIYANGSDESYITVTLKDKYDNTVGSGKSVSLSQNGASTITPAITVTDNEGRAFFTVKNSIPGTVTYTARSTTDNLTLTHTAAVDFTAYIWSVSSLADIEFPGTLRHAIINAPAGTAITFASGLSGTINLNSSLPAISKDMVIDGLGANVTISGVNTYRIFEITSGTVSIKNLSIVNGKAAGSNGADGEDGTYHASGYGYGGDPGATGRGGAMFITGGTVTIENVSFSNNQAIGGNGGEGGDGKGPGATYDDGGNGGSAGNGEGGAIYLNSGTLSVSNSSFSGNTAIGGQGGRGGNGTGVGGQGGHGGNGFGGAIFINTGSFNLQYCTFSNDSASGGNGGNGGGPGNNPGGKIGGNAGHGQGGAIYLNNGNYVISDIRFSNETITAGILGTGDNGNGSAGSAVGRDIYKQSGTITLSGVIFDAGGNSYRNAALAVVGNSSVTVNWSEVNSGGNASATVSVTLKDVSGMTVGSGKQVSLSQGSGRSVISPAVAVTDGNGIATFQVSDIYSETVTYSASDITDGLTLTQTASVYFLPSDINLSLFTAEPASATADGSDISTITVTQRLVNGDPAPGKTVTLNQGTGHSTISPSLTQTTNSNGQVIFTVVSSIAETVTYTASNITDGYTIPESVDVTFEPYAWIVSSLADTNTPGTLRHAVSSAPAGATINFQNGLSGTIILGSSLPNISRDLTIDATGANIIISGNDLYRVFYIDSGAVSIRNLTIAHGKAAGGNGATNWNGENGGNAYGGGLCVAGGTVNLINISFSYNSAIGGQGGNGNTDGAYSSGQYGGRGGDAFGGAVYMSAGNLNISGSMFDHNNASSGNGGNATYSWVSTYGGNGGNSGGGAVFAYSGTLSITDSRFMNNTITVGQRGSGVTLNGSVGTGLYSDLYVYSGTCQVESISLASDSFSYYNPAPADAGQSVLTVSPISVRSDGIEQSTVTVTLKYANGNPAPGKKITLSQGTGSSVITPLNGGYANNNGIAAFTVTNTVAEAVIYNAYDVSDNITVAQTASVTFTSSDPDSSEIAADPASVTANAGSSAVITVTLKFANGDIANGKPVTLYQGSGHSLISPAIAITDANGQATFTVMNGYTETVTYEARDTKGNILVSDTTNVTFTSYDWVVNSLSDTEVLGTLRHAVKYAQPGSSIIFASGLNGTISLSSPLPTINKDLAVNGAGATVTISGNDQYRIFQVESGTVSIKNLVLTHGMSTGNNGTFAYPTGNSGGHGFGGSLNITGGTVALDNIYFNSNSAIGGAGGGGIGSNNVSCYRGGWGGGGYGGAIYLGSGSLTIKNCRFEGNKANGGRGGDGWAYGGSGGNGYGGAIFISSGSLVISDSQFSANTVAYGPGDAASNTNGSNGGALYPDLYNYGGSCGANNVTFGSGESSYYGTDSVYTVSFDSHGGSLVSSIDVISGSVISTPQIAPRPGFALTGWYREASYDTIWNFSADTINADMTLHAKWTSVPIYTVTFKDWDNTVIKTDNVNEGSAPSAPGTPTRTGYTFTGWDKNMSNITSDLDVTAQYAINSYTLTFRNFDGTEIHQQSVVYSSAVSAPADPTRTGYTFAGWSPVLPATMPAENKTHTAQWTINQYTITFESNGGTSVSAITQNYGTAITAPGNPTKTGYTFAGWSPVLPGTVPAENKTHTAQWTVNQYTITFDSTGGTSVSSITQDYGTAVSAPGNPTKTGYTFAGWSPALPETMIGENKTLTAQWTANQYTITFDSAGGSTVAAITQDYATAITAPGNPTKTGYTFAGWSPALPATMPAENSTHTAQWTIGQYTITFDSNGGMSVGAITQDYGTAITAPGNPTKTGYTFAGWSPALPATMPGENTTHTAQWTPNQYTITFDSAGGSTVTAITQDYMTVITAPSNPTKIGYTFAGWSPALPATMPAENKTHTAQWTIGQYAITFDSTGGTSVSAITQDYGTTITAPGNPTKTGYTFAGWSPALPGTMPGENTTHTAQWTVNQYTITFDSAGGSNVTSITQDYGTAITAPANPTKTGYTFAGWSPALPGTVPAENKTHTAQWTINQYTITFDSTSGTAVDPMTQDYGTTITAPGNPTKTGYTFAGWSPALPGTMPGENTTHTAQWTVNQYTMTFDTAGGTVVAPVTQDYGTVLTASVNPTKTGYTFAGWSPALPGTMPAENKTHTAQWTINQYTITFDSNGGTSVSAITQDYGTTVTAPMNPTKTGYTFAGWGPVLPGTMPGENKTHTAQWTPNQYTITFDSAGGSNVTAITQDYATSVMPSADPVKAGYTFAGWNPALPGTVPAENTTHTAQWTINQYTVAFDSTGGTSVNAITQDYGTTVTPPGNPTRAGYTFAAWDVVIPNIMPANNVTIKALWTVNQYTITFDSAGGSNVTVITQDYGTTVTAPVNPTKTGYTFTGWSPVLPGTIPAENRTHTAQWTINLFTLSYYSEGNGSVSGISNQSVSHGSDGSSVSAIPDDGYLFEKWSDGSVDNPRTDRNVTADKTVYASFSPVIYTLTYSAGEHGTISGSTRQTVNSGSSGTSVKAVPDVGYRFAIWSDGVTSMVRIETGVIKSLNASASFVKEDSGQGDIPQDDGNNSATALVTANATATGSGNVSASVTLNQVNNAIDTALNAAGSDDAGMLAEVEIKVQAPTDATNVEVTIPQESLKRASDGGIDRFTSSNPLASVTFNSEALATLTEATGNVAISTAKLDNSTMSSEIQELIGDRPLYNFSVKCGETLISQFGGYVTVSIPYTPSAGEDINSIIIYYINANGKLETVVNCKYNAVTSTVSFITNHFSNYAIGYNMVTFKDVAPDASYSNAVSFIAAREITKGTGNGSFSPQAKLTRSEALVMLMRAYGIGPDSNPMDNFTDVGNTYYTNYLATAKRLGITKGVGNNKFAPDRAVTQQEMFTLLYNTMKVMSQLPQGTMVRQLSDFTDATVIADWAKESMAYLADTGIISNNKLSPVNTMTRADMAQVLYNLLSK